MSVTNEYGEIYYLKETDEGTVVQKITVVDFQVSQLKRIDEGTFNAKSFDIVNSSH